MIATQDMRKKIKINFSDFWHGDTEADKKNNPLFKLLSKKFELELSNKPDFLIYSAKGRKFNDYDCIRIFYTAENVRPNFDECDYAFSFDYPLTDRNYRLPLYKFRYDLRKLTAEKDVENILKNKTKFCNFVFSNRKTKTRIDFFEALSRYKKVDSGGQVLNNLGYLVKDKAEFLKPYKFTIAFENSSYPGYTTEKILDAMIANTVPIYWGNPLVHQDFNPKSFINCHEFDSFDKVIEKVVELDNDNELYKQYLAAPYFPNNTINEYLDDDAILDRFEFIFNNRAHRPVVRTWKGRCNRWIWHTKKYWSKVLARYEQRKS